MSPELRAFLQSWIDWVDRGAPNGEPYHRKMGLCGNSESSLIDEFEKLFQIEGLCEAFPFGESEYHLNRHSRTQHECPKRLAWVRNKLGGENAA